MKIAFVLNDLRLSGGVNVVLQHARRLASGDGDEVFLLVRESTEETWCVALIGDATIVPSQSWSQESYDIAIATYWETLLFLGEVRADSYVWFCQLYEDRFFPDRNPSISTMQIAGAIPLPVVTEAHWLRDLIASENPDRAIEVVLNGIDKDLFTESDNPSDRGPGFSVLIEGSLDAVAKNTTFAIEGSLRSAEMTLLTHVGNRPLEISDPRYRFVSGGLSFEKMAELYRSHHVQVKTSLAEGMFGPPLEGFHCGLPAIVTPVTGSDEYIDNGVNAIVVLWDDAHGVGTAIDSLAQDRALWSNLQRGARDTAQSWPDWDAQSKLFKKALVSVAKTSKLSQSDLANLGRAMQFADMMHWLAMRRLSDKSSGPRVMDELVFGATASPNSFLRKVARRLTPPSSQ